MAYDTSLGISMAHKYLVGSGHLETRLEHSLGVGRFALKVASRIKEVNPDITEGMDPEFSAFLGYVHDIGYSLGVAKHELHTIQILANGEKVPFDLARKAMHGPLAEQFNDTSYLPAGLDGIILSYCDLSVRIGDPISIEDRYKDMFERLALMPESEEKKREVGDSLNKALPRFKRYERLVLRLADAVSFKDF